MKKLGKYEIVAELGRGAMGVVYKARDPFIGRLVALKTITTGLTEKPELLDRFYQEARSAGTLQHPNIVTIYELGQEKDTPFIAMEFLEGDSLDKIVETRPSIALFQKLEYIVRVCEALDHAHRHGVVHRDVKPGNVMVTADGVVKVVDFGIARLTDTSMTQANMMIGSRAYMSPQLYKGERADARSDIWAVGVTLYELLTFQRPFNGDSEAELMYNIIYNAPPSLKSLAPDCNDELARIVGKMLEKKTEDRFQTMEDVLHELEPYWRAAQQSTVAGLLADSKSLVEANDFERAQRLLRKALHIDVGNATAKSLLEKVNAELRRTQIQPKIQEHIGRGRTLLQGGHLREARAEAEAALGLDSRQETALKFLAEVEAALEKAEQLDQKLRLTKQRLAEGALTEAATALGQALELDATNAQAQELKKQFDDEQKRREKRKKMAEVLHRARSLWAELNYNECLAVLSAALQEFPGEPELLKLQETARNDQAEEQKRARFAETRKLLGEQKFPEALKLADDLARQFPHDGTVISLRGMAQQGLLDLKRGEYLQQQLTDLRALVSAGKYAETVAKAEPLLKEFPQEYAVKELATYAQGELAQQQQKQKETERQQQIRGFLDAGKNREAEEAARRAVQEFPRIALFQQLLDEAQRKRKEQDVREELQRRMKAIQGNIQQQKHSDAVALAQQTLAAFGPNNEVTQLLHSAQQEQQIHAAKTMADAGNFAGATQLLDNAIATQILKADDPRAELLRTHILRSSGAVPAYKPESSAAPPAAPKPADAPTKPPAKPEQPRPDAAAQPTAVFSATQVVKTGDVASSGQTPQVKKEAATKTAAPVQPAKAPAVATPSGQMPAASSGTAKPKPNVAVLAGVGAAAVLLLVVGIWWAKHRSGHGSADEEKLRNLATQQWTEHQLDASLQSWQQLAQLHGSLQKEAQEKIVELETKKTAEKARFDDGESLLKDKKDYVGAQQAFQDVVQMNLWLVDDANRELESAKALASGNDIKKQEQDHFTQGEQFYQGGNLDKASTEFQTVVTLNVADSTLKPKAESYLKKIRGAGNEKKIYDAALQDIKDENWTQAREGLQEVVNRKGPLSGDAKKQLAGLAGVGKIQDAFSDALKNNSYQAAKAQVDAAKQWPKTQQNLRQQLQAAEQQELNSLKGRAQPLQEKGDATGIEHLQDELHGFLNRAEDPGVVKSGREFDSTLAFAALKLRQEQSGDKNAFETAVRDFNKAKQAGDIDQLSHGVTQQFQKIANGKGLYRDQAQLYVKTTIPATIQGLTKTLNGKALVPPIECRGNGPADNTTVNGSTVPCAQLDPGTVLEWVGTPMVDYPDSASKGNKLPYTLSLLVYADAKGEVKIEKAGNVDNDFFKKAKDAAKHWRTTVPRSGGKPVNVSFPITVVFNKR